MGLDGIINVLKPPGMTSSDVVVYLRKLLNVKKVGHTGTLDPGAAGVLVLCLGRATKISSYIMADNKVYKGGLSLGIETDTLDADGRIINKTMLLPDYTDIEKAFAAYQGKMLQHPPMYSARKYKGKRLYELARRGERADVPPREIEIFENRILDFSSPDKVSFLVSCTKGTYIRSLAKDIGDSLGCGAHLAFLIRIANGPFTIEGSYTLQEIGKAFSEGKIDDIIIPMDKALLKFRSVELEDRALKAVVNGNAVEATLIKSKEVGVVKGELLKVYCKGKFLGLGYIDDNNRVRMRKVLVGSTI
ncbi:MAG: tRNA pseudouridine(55) synthase TruB [Clostridiales bacterium]|nr:tRNA pseudouridine(55) synthase TruB [Clostridiales bacterium]